MQRDRAIVELHPFAAFGDVCQAMQVAAHGVALTGDGQVIAHVVSFQDVAAKLTQGVTLSNYRFHRDTSGHRANFILGMTGAPAGAEGF